jgi:hypothetical protein
MAGSVTGFPSVQESAIIPAGNTVYHVPIRTQTPSRQEDPMAKGDQRSNKMTKKPKKDTSPPKPGTSDRPMPPVTQVIPRGKEKK